MKLTTKMKKAILQDAAQCFPQECCGVIVDGTYIACRNLSEHHDQFEIHPDDLAKVEDLGEIQAYVHSHPNATARASELDRHQIELHQKPWVICAYPDVEFQVHQPFGYKAPLVGRDYYHGWQDCYSIVRDFYQREFGLQLIDFERQDRWWESKDHESLYLNGFKQAGFVEVDHVQYGDVLLCKVGRTEHVNHAVIYLDHQPNLKSEVTSALVGGPFILHHPYQRKSVREIYGSQWQERVAKVVRHVKNN